ncbi:MAG: HU family DNA-binding protein [Holosporales bacterium]|jgi:integration host factor subunit alpha|nr:HU family DNA-binding protein [Holosporales bacterium]
MKRDPETKTVIRVQLAEVLAREFGLYRFQAENFIETVLEEIGAALASGEEVKVAGFGTFRVVERKGRIGRNPRTQESAEIKARKAIVFRPSGTQKARVNKKSAHK